MSKGWVDAKNREKNKNQNVNGANQEKKEVSNADEAGSDLIDKLEESIDAQLRKNSSSPEVEGPEGDDGPIVEVDADDLMKDVLSDGDKDEDGGVSLS
jgi:Ca2+-dependent lipid-binding protein